MKTLKKVVMIKQSNSIDRAVFSELDISPPSVETVNFCELDRDLVKSLQHNVVIATDVVFFIFIDMMNRHFHQILLRVLLTP